MTYFHEYLKDIALMFVEQKSTVDDIKAERDLTEVCNAIKFPEPTRSYVDYLRNLDTKLYYEYPEIEDLCKVASTMQTFSVPQSVETKSELENATDNLVRDYFGILVSVLIKHKKIEGVKDFIKKVC